MFYGRFRFHFRSSVLKKISTLFKFHTISNGDVGGINSFVCNVIGITPTPALPLEEILFDKDSSLPACSKIDSCNILGNCMLNSGANQHPFVGDAAEDSTVPCWLVKVAIVMEGSTMMQYLTIAHHIGI